MKMRLVRIIVLALVSGLVYAQTYVDGPHTTPEPEPTPFARAIEVVEFVAHNNLTTKQSASDLMSTITIVDLLWDLVSKALAVLVQGIMYAVSLIFDPATTTTFSSSGPVYYSASGNRGQADYDYRQLVDSVAALPDQAFTLLDIKEMPCRKRAVCELGSHLTTYVPVLSDWIRLVAKRIESSVASAGSAKYARDIARGLGWNDCHIVYETQCPVSPFKKFVRLYHTLAKLY